MFLWHVWQKRDSVDARKSVKAGDSLKLNKKFKDLESASASRRSRSARKPSTDYTADPTTPPKDTRTSAGPTTPVNHRASGDATELDRMLVANEDNYLKPEPETPLDGVQRKNYFSLRSSSINLPYFWIHNKGVPCGWSRMPPVWQQ